MTERIEHIAEGITLYLGDCCEVMPVLGSVDHVITDPPFEAEAHTLQRRINRGETRGGPSDVVTEEPLDFDPLTPAQRRFVSEWSTKHCRGWLLAFCQAEAVSVWREEVERAGASYKRAMVWIKPDGMPQYSGDRPGMGYESIVSVWCAGGRSRWNGGGRHGVFTHNKNSGGKHEHKTQKPTPLMGELVLLFTSLGETILDPFMGSGTTGVASDSQARGFIGIERQPQYFDVACRRIRDALKQQDLFVPKPTPAKQEALPI